MSSEVNGIAERRERELEFPCQGIAFAIKGEITAQARVNTNMSRSAILARVTSLVTKERRVNRGPRRLKLLRLSLIF